MTSTALYRKAYGRGRDCSLHTSTFSGLGESCAVAIETLNTYQDDNLIERAGEMGDYLRGKLARLQEAYPGSIEEICGRGLMTGIRLKFDHSLTGRSPKQSRFALLRTLDSVFMVATLRALLEDCQVLAHFAPSDPTVVHVLPPLIVSHTDIDHFVESLETVLARGIMRTTARFIQSNVKDRHKVSSRFSGIDEEVSQEVSSEAVSTQR